jgi:hypothetical protein
MSRNKAKKEMVDALVKYRGKVECKLSTGTVDTNGQLIRINIKHYLNVLFSKKLKPLVAERSAKLSKQHSFRTSCPCSSNYW